MRYQLSLLRAAGEPREREGKQRALFFDARREQFFGKISAVCETYIKKEHICAYVVRSSTYRRLRSLYRKKVICIAGLLLTGVVYAS